MGRRPRMARPKTGRELTTVEKRGTKIKHKTQGTVGTIVGSYLGGFKVYVPKEKETFGLPFTKVRDWTVIEASS